MGIIMFAIVGALIDAPAGYWITYGILAGLKVFKAAYDVIQEKL